MPGQNPFLSFGKSGKLGIEITGDFLKLVMLQNVQGKQTVTFLSSIPVKNMSDDDITKALLPILKSLPVKFNESFLVLPVTSAIIKTIQIPSINENEIKDILNLQAGRETPYSREELIVDYIKLSQIQGIYTKVLVVIVTREAIMKMFTLLQGAGVNVTKIFFSAEGICVWCSQVLTPEAFDPTRAIVNIDTETADFSIFSEQGLLFTRTIPIGLNTLNQGKEGTVNKFIEEIKNSVEAYQIEDISKMPNSLFVTRTGKVLPALRQELSGALGMSVNEAALTRRIEVEGEYKARLDDDTAPSFIGPIANTLFSDNLHINLVPENIKLKRKFEQKGRKITMAGVLCMVIFFQICMTFILKMFYKENYLNSLARKFEEKIDEADHLRVVSEKTRTLKHYLSNKSYAIDGIIRLYEVVPDEIYIKGLTIDQEKKLFIKGTSKSMSRIFAFVTELENDPLFSGVKTEFTESKKERGEDVSEFGIVMQVEQNEL